MQDAQRAQKALKGMSASACELVLVRHGQTTWNVEARLQVGWQGSAPSAAPYYYVGLCSRPQVFGKPRPSPWPAARPSRRASWCRARP